MSAAYRKDVHRRWETELRLVKTLDIAGGVFTVLITTTGVVLVAAAIWGVIAG